LLAIGTSAAFNSATVPKVYRTAQDEYNAEAYPWCMVAGAGEVYERSKTRPFAEYHKTLTLGIEYRDQYPTTYSEDAWCARMVADVEYALRDWTLGGEGGEMDIKSNERIETDKSDGDRVIAVLFVVDVTYRIARNDPATRV